jgi:hypothetical protein
MKWPKGLAYGAMLGLILLALGWVGPNLVGDPASLVWMLKPAYQVPELLPSYTPELVEGIRFSLASCIGSATIGFVFWDLVILISRPSGPGQIRTSWRRVIWWLTWVSVLITAGVLPYVALTFWLDTVEIVVATRLAVGLSLVAVLVFWLLSAVGAEPMMRPAVPLGDRFVGVR